MAKEGGYLSKYGIEAELIYIPAVAATQALIAGEIQLAQVTGVSTAGAILAGADVRIIASVQDRLESLGYRTSLVEIGGGASSVPMVEHNPHHSHGSQGENLSWGKFDPEGRRTTVYMDATVALPMLVLGLLQSREVSDIMSRRKPLKFSNLSGEQLQIQKPN